MDALVRPVARSVDIERPSLSAYVVNSGFVRYPDLAGVKMLHLERMAASGKCAAACNRSLQRQLWAESHTRRIPCE
jgi:hypothetical protein